MTTELKKLPPKSKPTGTLTFSRVFTLSMAFWAAGFIFATVIVPILACLALLTLAMLGISLPSG